MFIFIVLKLFSPMRALADWQIGDIDISMPVHVSAESDRDELSEPNKHLEGMCCHEICSRTLTCHRPAPFRVCF